MYVQTVGSVPSDVPDESPELCFSARFVASQDSIIEAHSFGKPFVQ